MNTLKKQRLHTFSNVSPKVVGYIIVGFLVLALVVGLSLSSSNNSGKSAPAVAPTIGMDNSETEDNEEETIPAVTKNPVITGDDERVDERMIEESGYKDVEGFEKYMSHYHEYYEGSYNAGSWEEENGYTLYIKVLSIKKGEYLTFSVGYLDSHENWHEIKKFISKGAKPSLNPEEAEKDYYRYYGGFHYLDNLNEEKNGGTFVVLENTHHGFGIDGDLYTYTSTGSPHASGSIFRINISYDLGPSI